jgi:hypothetical protein
MTFAQRGNCLTMHSQNVSQSLSDAWLFFRRKQPSFVQRCRDSVLLSKLWRTQFTTRHSFSLSKRHIRVRAIRFGDCDRGTGGVPGVLTDRRRCRRPVVEETRSFFQVFSWAVGPTQLPIRGCGGHFVIRKLRYACTTNLCLVPSLRMSGTVATLGHIASWHLLEQLHTVTYSNVYSTTVIRAKIPDIFYFRSHV